MAGLVDYGSSDEESTVNPPTRRSPSLDAVEEVLELRASKYSTTIESKTNGRSRPTHFSEVEADAPMVGPAIGPADSEEAYIPSPSAEVENSAPLSPYSANRARLRQLTLPPIPNLNIPDSPPRSTPASTSAKFAHFLELKKQGVHFNEKLAKSSALKNPSLMQKLLDFADIDEAGQYDTTLPKELWNPRVFPEWAYKEELAKSQQNVLKKKEEEKARGPRESVDFVPASASGDSSRGGTPGASVGGGRVVNKSAAERVIAGLNRGRATSPAVHSGMKRKSRFEN